MYAHERFGVETRLYVVHRLAQEVAAPLHVQLDVVVFGLYPVYLVRTDEGDAAARLNQETRLVSRGPLGGGSRVFVYVRRTTVFEQRDETAAQVFQLALRELLLGARERLLEARVVEGLQEIVERVEVEGFERVSVEGRDEDDDGQALCFSPIRPAYATRFPSGDIET